MSQPSWFDQTPMWVWWSFIPAIGGAAIAYAGVKVSSNIWIGLGASFVVAAIVLAPMSGPVAGLIWLAQVITAFSIKREYLAKNYPKHLPLPEDPQLFAAIAAHRPKVEINSCSKNDLVNVLGLPIVYANDIDSLRAEGHIFTSLEELHDIIEIPNLTLKRIEPMVIFTYDYRQEAAYSWKRINLMTAAELIAIGVEPTAAIAIVEERQKHGDFKSVMDIKKRTGVPFSSYKQIT
jgi:DNA uptake protein ComE-like DNA-binding protein